MKKRNFLLMTALSLIVVTGCTSASHEDQSIDESIASESMAQSEEITELTVEEIEEEHAQESSEEALEVKAKEIADFTIDGMWQSSDGTIYSFNNGAVSASLFGFNGGPDGSYTLSSKTDENNNYTLHCSHITGGELVYLVSPKSMDSIVLNLEGETTFGASTLTLERK